jgi:ABC-type nickel/cobalt efflux system permease component RcnA
MIDFSSMLQQGSGSAWLFVPSAIALGALHGLEPGHSKTMMAAFIIAVRGTVAQAVLLGLSATVSHTAVVWALAFVGLYFGQNSDVLASEPYYQLLSGALIIATAIWMAWRVHKANRQHHAHDHGHEHHHHDHHHAGAVDAHAQAHAEQIRHRFTGQQVTNGQIVMFGLTGGLIPCPASITVLLLCLQLKQFALGAALVLSFSVGLALTMVASGALAALSVRHASKAWGGFGAFAEKAPYLSSALMLVVGSYIAWEGWSTLIFGAHA